jgi:hypothetical protein
MSVKYLGTQKRVVRAPQISKTTWATLINFFQSPILQGHLHNWFSNKLVKDNKPPFPLALDITSGDGDGGPLLISKKLHSSINHHSIMGKKHAILTLPLVFHPCNLTSMLNHLSLTLLHN